jgi:hypothetical protein
MMQVLNAKDFLGGIPANAVYIGRYHSRFGSSRWGNPVKLAKNATEAERGDVVSAFRRWICDQPKLMAALPQLRGRDLVCWCAPLPCHGNVLMELANR